MGGLSVVVCIPHRQRGCLICNPEPAARVAERRPNTWHRDGAGWIRQDTDGTVWTISRAVVGGVDLVLTYRDHRLRSHHDTAANAKRHRDKLVAAWQAQTLREWMRRG